MASKGAVATEKPAAISEDAFDVRPISLELLRESPLNTRKSFADDEQSDLIASIKEHGIITALLVRSDGKYFEILAGARRFRAAMTLKMETVPCRVVAVKSDERALELVIVENLQRVNVHPMEEAQGFNDLLERSGGDIEGVAAKTGKTRAYIHQSLALLSLITPLHKLFIERRMGKEIATKLARLPKESQKAAVDLWEHDDPTVNRVLRWIDESVTLDVAMFPWDLKDPDLNKKAVACSICPKRSGCEKELFADMVTNDRCLDPGCHSTKMNAHIDRTIKGFKAEKKPFVGIWTAWHNESPKEGIYKQGFYSLIEKKEHRCENAVTAITLDGAKTGHLTEVCVTPECKKHFNGGGATSSESMQRTEKQKLSVKKFKSAKLFRIAQLSAIKDKMKDPPSAKTMQFIANELYGKLWHEHKKQFAKVYGIKGEEIKGTKALDLETPIHKMIEGWKEQNDFDRFFVVLGLMGEMDPRYSKGTWLGTISKELGIDQKALIDKLSSESSTTKVVKKMEKKPVEKKPDAAAPKAVGKVKSKAKSPKKEAVAAK